MRALTEICVRWRRGG